MSEQSQNSKKYRKSKRMWISDIRREELTLAALKCIIDKGYDNVRLEDVEEEAGFSKGMAFYYFKKKEELLVSVLRKMRADLMEITKRIIGIADDIDDEQEIYKYLKEYYSDPRIDLEAVLKNGIQISLSWIHENPNVLQVVLEFWCKYHRNRIVAELTNSMQSFLRNITLIFIEEGIKRGIFKKQAPDIAAYALISSLQGIAFYYVNIKEEQFEKLKNEINDLIFNYLIY